MHATNVRNLKKNPSAMLRQAEVSPVLVLKGDEPNAFIVHIEKNLVEGEQSIRPAIAASLFKDGTLSLGKAARVSALPLQDFIEHLSNLGIDIVSTDETTDSETKNLDQWLTS